MGKDLIAVMRYSLDSGYDWKIDKVLVDELRSRIDVHFARSGNASACLRTGEMGVLYDHRREKTWRHVDLLESKRFTHRQVPRIQSFAGVEAIKNLWTGATNRFTHVFECWPTNLLKESKTAKLLRCGLDVIYGILHRSMLPRHQRRSPEGIQHLRVVDKAIRRGDTYTAIVSATERDIVLDVGKGRNKVSTKSMITCLLGTARLIQRLLRPICGTPTSLLQGNRLSA